MAQNGPEIAETAQTKASALITQESEDRLSPSSFAREIVGVIENNYEGLEGDGARMENDITEGIKAAVELAQKDGELAPGDIKVDFAIRDPEQGEGTLFLEVNGTLDQNGNITLDFKNAGYSYYEDEDFKEGIDPTQYAQGVINNLNNSNLSEEQNDAFIKGETNLSHTIGVFQAPEVPQP